MNAGLAVRAPTSAYRYVLRVWRVYARLWELSLFFKGTCGVLNSTRISTTFHYLLILGRGYLVPV